MKVSCDTSFLFSLYGNDAFSTMADKWLLTSKSPLYITVLGDFEFNQVLLFSEFSGKYPEGYAKSCNLRYERDRTAGKIIIEHCNLARVIDEAKILSNAFTLNDGNRAMDILQVAGAKVMNATVFLTFDEKQAKLAAKLKLKLLQQTSRSMIQTSLKPLDLVKTNRK